MIRKEEKEKTRKRIIKFAIDEFTEYGYRGAKTARIAEKAGVAHGTVFLHFRNKDTLLYEIIHERLFEVSNRLYSAIAESKNPENMLRVHLQHIGEELAFESMLARELPLFPQDLRRKIFAIRSGVIAQFYDVLIAEIQENRIKDINPTIALNFWFGTINYFLANQDMFAPPGKIIELKGEDMIRFFITTIRR